MININYCNVAIAKLVSIKIAFKRLLSLVWRYRVACRRLIDGIPASGHDRILTLLLFLLIILNLESIVFSIAKCMNKPKITDATANAMDEY